MQPAGEVSRRRCVRALIARADDQADAFDAGAQRLFKNDLQRRFLLPITIDQRLERQRMLAPRRRRDHRLAYLHSNQPPTSRKMAEVPGEVNRSAWTGRKRKATAKHAKPRRKTRRN